MFSALSRMLTLPSKSKSSGRFFTYPDKYSCHAVKCRSCSNQRRNKNLKFPYVEGWGRKSHTFQNISLLRASIPHSPCQGSIFNLLIHSRELNCFTDYEMFRDTLPFFLTTFQIVSVLTMYEVNNAHFIQVP